MRAFLGAYRPRGWPARNHAGYPKHFSVRVYALEQSDGREGGALLGCDNDLNGTSIPKEVQTAEDAGVANACRHSAATVERNP